MYCLNKIEIKKPYKSSNKKVGLSFYNKSKC